MVAKQEITATANWWVYMVRCADGTLYTGISTDVLRRLRQHNGEIVGGAKYTAARRPVTLVYQQACADRSAAGQAEYRLRRMSRSKKLALAVD